MLWEQEQRSLLVPILLSLELVMTWVTFVTTVFHLLVYFESASVITSLVLLGRYLENRAKWKANDAVQGNLYVVCIAHEIGLIAMQPLYANKTFNDGSILKVPIESVDKDDIIVVRPGIYIRTS